MSKVLDLLSDGKWHTHREIQQKIRLDDRQTEQVIEFLERYCLIMVDKATRKVMLSEEVQRFFGSKI